MKLYQAKLNGDQFTFSEIKEFSFDLIQWNSSLDFQANSGIYRVYYEKGLPIDIMDNLWMQCQKYFE